VRWRRYVKIKGANPLEDRDADAVAQGERAVTHLGREQLREGRHVGAAEEPYEAAHADVRHEDRRVTTLQQEEDRDGEHRRPEGRADQERLRAHPLGDNGRRRAEYEKRRDADHVRGERAGLGESGHLPHIRCRRFSHALRPGATPKNPAEPGVI